MYLIDCDGFALHGQCVVLGFHSAEPRAQMTDYERNSEITPVKIEGGKIRILVILRALRSSVCCAVWVILRGRGGR